MKFISLFAGIGGIDLGLHRAGMECVAQVEIDPYARKVLAKHWPEVPRYEDVKSVGRRNLPDCDVIAGGFPCQDVSYGDPTTRIGLSGERSGLWREYHRLICELRPSYSIIENVAALLMPVNDGSGGSEPAPIATVLRDLAEIGYDAEWEVLPAVAFGAPHERERAFVIAYPQCQGLQRRVFDGSVPIRYQQRFAQLGNAIFSCGANFADDSEGLCVGDGVPLRLARRAVKGYGNAVVPQVAEYIGRMIMQHAQAMGAI